MKILIVGPSWVGDMVMAQTLFRCLRQNSPDAILDVLAPDWSRALLDRMPEVCRAIPMPIGHGRLAIGDRRQLGKLLRAEGYQQAIVLPNSFKSALVPWFAGIPKRTGWRGEARSWILNDCRVLDKTRYPLMIERFAALAYPSSATLPAPLPWPALRVDETSVTTVKRKFSLLLDRSVVAMCPGAEFGPAKKWPSKYYGELAAQCIEEGRQVWLLGSANDSATAREIQAMLSIDAGRHCIDFTGRTSLAEAIDLLVMADAVVSNDSGLMHIAAAVGKPLVVLYGSTSPAFTPPLSENVKIMSLELECRPCFARECPLEHLHCLKWIEPATVMVALRELAG